MRPAGRAAENLRFEQFAKGDPVPKLLLFGVLAVVDFVAAYLFYADGRIVFPALLVVAGLGFAAAAVGTAMGKG